MIWLVRLLHVLVVVGFASSPKLTNWCLAPDGVGEGKVTSRDTTSLYNSQPELMDRSLCLPQKFEIEPALCKQFESIHRW